MRIDDFETCIEEKILERGKRYFSDDLVIDLWSETPNQFCAVVNGSIPYDVEIHLDGAGMIVRHGCDCPYNWGEYCKHEVAVLLVIRNLLKQGTKLKKHGQKQGLRSRLSTKEKDDLIYLLCDLAAEYNLWDEIVCYLDGIDDED